MKFAFFTNSISPHQLPVAKELVRRLGEQNYVYVYTNTTREERRRLGWADDAISQWCKKGDALTVELIEADVLMSSIRALNLFENRASKNKKTLYVSERWFKPTLGFLRLLVPSYYRMAKRMVKLLSESENFYYYPMGIHAARDMARLCGLLHGDLKCLFKAPELDFECMPGGEICLKNGCSGKRYCLEKMRMWGYFVQSSEFRDNCKKGGDIEQQECRDQKEISVLWVGRLLDWKRVDTIIRAVGECSKSKKITLDIYGFGPEEKKLKKMAAKYGNVIKFYPPVLISEVRKLMREHDIYVLSSNGYEGWGAVVSEALEEGMRVIGTYEAGASATILPCKNLFHAGDWHLLCQLFRKNKLELGRNKWTAKEAIGVLWNEICA